MLVDVTPIFRIQLSIWLVFVFSATTSFPTGAEPSKFARGRGNLEPENKPQQGNTQDYKEMLRQQVSSKLLICKIVILGQLEFTVDAVDKNLELHPKQDMCYFVKDAFLLSKNFLGQKQYDMYQLKHAF